MKVYILFLLVGMTSLYFKTCNAGQCSPSTACGDKCYTKYTVSCGWLWKNRCTKYRSYSCNKKCRETPVCSSSRLPRVSYGVYKQSSSVSSVATLTCNSGYVVSGTGVAFCQSSGYWTSSGASCKRKAPVCSSSRLPRVSYGVYKQSSSVSSVATLTCNSGYVVSGTGVAFCQSSGYWTSYGASCKRKVLVCSSSRLPRVSYGVYKQSSSVSSVATLTCNSGYVVSGTGVTFCQSNGYWNSSGGLCKPKAPVCPSSRLPPVSNGVYKPAGSVATLACKPGHEINGTGVVLCLANGNWAKPAASCKPTKCGPLPSVSNGQFQTDTTSVSLNAVAQLECANGYKQFPASSTTYQVSCGIDGLWSPIKSDISCKITDCGKSPEISGGRYDILSGTEFGNQAILSCDEKHVLKGEPAFIQCQSSGEWSKTSATCVPDCGKPPTPSGGSYDTTNGTEFGSQAKLSCDERHVLEGEPDFIECQASGDWSSSPTTCEPVCSGEWIEHENSCYLFGKEELNYTIARKVCQDNGASLVQVDSVSENQYLKDTMAQLAQDDKDMEPEHGYWNDLFEETTNGNEVWRETQTPLDPDVSDWNGSQPDDANGGQQTCTMFWRDFQYKWADIECDAVGKPDRLSTRLGRALCERNLAGRG